MVRRRPTANDLFEELAIQFGKQIVQRRTAGGNLSRETQRGRKSLAAIPSELGNGVQTSRPGKDRHSRQRQNRR
jgi:hypothetical protein